MKKVLAIYKGPVKGLKPYLLSLMYANVVPFEHRQKATSAKVAIGTQHPLCCYREQGIGLETLSGIQMGFHCRDAEGRRNYPPRGHSRLAKRTGGGVKHERG